VGPSPPRPALVFDLDGVLVDSTEFVVGGWLAVAAAVGRSMSPEEIRERLDGRRTADILRDEFGLTGDAAAPFLASTDDRTEEIAGGVPLPPIAGAVEFVRKARADGWRIALVSSASPTNVGLALRTIGLAGVFPVIVDAGRTARGKPHPEPYLLAADSLGLAPSGMVVFEDSLAGLASARAAGAHRIGLATTRPRERLVDAELVIADFRGWTPERIVDTLLEANGHRSKGADPGR
jgi:HAD superfamily hydrolase (TIGR01509 family)